MSTLAAVAAAAVSGGLLLFAFPPFDLGSLAFFAFVPLFLVLRERRPATRFFLGWVAGNAAYTAAVASSIRRAADAYYDQPWWIDTGFALVAPQIYGVLYLGLFALLAGPELGRPLARRLVTVPALWVAVELLRARLWHGAPWLLLAHSQHDNLRLIQIADIVGSLGIGFVIVLVNVLLESVLRRRRRAQPLSLRPLLVACAVLALVSAYGEVQIRRWEPSGSGLRVAIVQPALPAEWRATLAGVPRSLERLRQLSASVTGEPVDLLIWPENALGFSLAGNDDLGRRVAAAAHGAPTLLGAPRTVDAGDGVRFRNSAFLVDGAGRLATHYDKLRLTPWAEYRPLRLGSFGTDGFAGKDPYESGTVLQLFELGRTRFATLICFEAIYPELGRAFVARGAEFLVNLSNDDWFENEAAVQQHFVASLFRAVENRRTLVRVTNSGQSGVVDARGEVVLALARDRPEATVVTIEPIQTRTFYTLWGDGFAWVCVAITVVARIRDRNDSSR